MKKILLLLCVTVFLSKSFAQVAINNTNTPPHASAMLDIKSDSKGLLIPRLSTTGRIGIVSPAKGLIVYDTTLSTFFYHTGLAWTQLSTGANTNYWNINGTNIYNNNAGNIGIGTSTPTHARLELNGSVGAAVAMFGADKCGVTIEVDNPEIGFNYFFNGTTKTIKTGYASLFGMDPGNGDMYFGNFNGSQSTSNFGNITGFQRVATFSQNGKFGFGMTPTSYNSRMQIGCDGSHYSAIDFFYSGTYCGEIRPNSLGNLNITAPTNWSGSTPGNLILQETSYVGLPIAYAGDVVIGTSGTPLAKLHVEGFEGNTVAMFRRFNTSSGISIISDWPGIFGNCYFNDGNKTMSATGYSGAMNFNQDDGSIDFLTHNGVNTAANAAVSLDERMRIGRDGRVSIGTVWPANGYLLSVAGKVICEEVNVKYQAYWPDYVFNKDYKLASLREVENYIAENKHLPNMPDASKIEKDGIPIGEMQKKMMEKIEELTLYIIAQDKKISDLESRLDSKK